MLLFPLPDLSQHDIESVDWGFNPGGQLTVTVNNFYNILSNLYMSKTVAFNTYKIKYV